MAHAGFLAPIHQKPLTEPETVVAQNRIVVTFTTFSLLL